MRRTSAPSLLLVLLSAPALAQWTAVNVAGTPYDVEIPDAGIVAVASSTGAFLFVGSGGGPYAQAVGPAGNMVSAYVDPATGCLCSTTRATGQVTCCGVNQAALSGPGADDPVIRLRHTRQGSRFFGVTPQGLFDSFGYSPNASTTPYVLAPGTCADINTTALTAARIGGRDYGVMAVPGVCGYVFSVDGAVATANPYGDPGVGVVNEVALYESADAGVSVLLAHGGGVDTVTFLDGGLRVTTPVPVAGIPEVPVAGIAYASGTGDQYGDGFGLAVVRGAEDRIYGPIPDPSRPGETWVERTPAAQVGSVGPLSRVSCLGARLCGVIADPSATARLLIYENLNRPRVFVPDAGLAETGSSVTLAADAGDLDGDPVFVRWFPGDAGISYSLTPLTADGRTARVDVAPGVKLCGVPFVDLPIQTSVSDGLAGNATFHDTSVRIFHTVAPLAPLVTGPTRVQAGTGAVTLLATTAPGECAALGGFTWTPTATVPNSSFTAVPPATSATFTPPTNLCAPEATATYDVVVGDGQLTSAPARVSIIVEGWGPPNPAFPAGARVQQDAGTTVTYRADGGHPCQGTSGLPTPTVVWRLISSDVSGAALVAGGSPVVGQVTAPEVSLTAPECTTGTVQLGATQRGTDTAALSAPEAVLTVDVTLQLAAVQDANVALTADYAPSAFKVSGTVDSDLNCTSLRAGTFAEVTVLRGGAPLSSPAVVNVPGAYQLPVQVGCGGGDLEVTAQLVDADGGRSELASVPFTAPALPAGVGDLDGGVLRVACGTGGRGTVTSSFPDGVCPLSELRWTQLSGPTLAEPVLTGTSVALQTAASGLDGLIGEQIVLQVDADAGFGNVGTGTHSLLLIPDGTFVSMRHSTLQPTVEEGTTLGVRVDITNDTTSCGINNVTLTEQLQGAEYVPGTSRLDGVLTEAVLTGDDLVLPAVTLEPGVARVWTYSVRPRLLGSVAPKGVASVKGLAVSETSEITTPQGSCGCSSSPGGLLAAAVWLAALVRRRSRRR